MLKVRKAVFPVGGLGTRFLPATKALPKEMLPVWDKPLIQYAVEEALNAGIEQFIFVTGRGKSAIEDHFDDAWELSQTLNEKGKEELLKDLLGVNLNPGQVVYTRQKEPLGLGHAVWCAREIVGQEPFAVLLADDFILSQQPCLAQMISAFQENQKTNMAAVMEVPLEQTSRYGILDVAP
ncbi:MAG: NTP transferase domain-containing protein, partial [bacterium]|nr:NTP transferase domain-containing protein [bacterium]